MKKFFKKYTCFSEDIVPQDLGEKQVGRKKASKPRKPKELIKGDVRTTSHSDVGGYSVELDGLIHLDNVDDFIDWLERWRSWADYQDRDH